MASASGSTPAPTVAATPVAVSLADISKRFEHQVKGQVYAVRSVSISIAPGELLTLLGPSGCGKTTTLRMVAGFEQPDAGRIVIGERDVTHLMANERNIGFVFQNYALFPHLSVFENVAYGLRIQRQSQAEIARAVGEVLRLVGLGGFERQQPHQLSGGEQQRVALARAIVFRPRVLLFDEPLSNLDAKLRVQMRDEIRELQKRLGITTIYVTHDQEEAMAISDRIAVMDRGEIVQVGSAEALYHTPSSVFVARFIGNTNLLTGRVTGVRHDGMEIEVAGRALRIASPASKVSPGDTVRLVVRPEIITIRQATGDGFRGTVQSRVFLGEKADYRVDLGDQVLQVTSYGPRHALAFQPGDEVALDFPTDGVHVLTD
jgi:spermidine/putrescine ABC transporter ATP-binding subunit